MDDCCEAWWPFFTPMITATFSLDESMKAYDAAKDTAANVKVHINNSAGASA